MLIFQGGAQKSAFQQQSAFSFSLKDAEAQGFLNMKGKLPINITEQILKAVNP